MLLILIKQQTACFDPRPRAGSDDYCWNAASSQLAVSIRAPVRGATWPVSLVKLPKGFDPRPRAGSDYWHGEVKVVPAHVSIRAPVRGATRW